MSSLLAPALAGSRPVVDAAIDSLGERAEEIARAWAAALVRARPLERIGEVPLDAIALHGPELCAATLRAVQSDRALEEIARYPTQQPGPVALAELTGARGPADLAADIETLRGVIWERLELALAHLPGRTLAEAGDRLAAACAAALGAALASGAPAEPRPGSASVGIDQVPAASSPAAVVAAAGRPHGPAVVVDEAAPASPAAGSTGVAAVAGEDAMRPASSESPREGADSRAASPAELDADEIVIRAAQPDGGGPAWIRILGGALERHLRDGAPFGVLLAEIVAPDDPALVARVSAAVERVLESEARASMSRADAVVVTAERRGRWWMLARGADRQTAEQLAERLTDAVGRTPMPEGVVLAVGSASCPQDGDDAAALAAHADVGLYAARAALRRRGAIGEPVY